MKVIVYKANMGAALISLTVMLVIALAICIFFENVLYVVVGIIGLIAAIAIIIHYYTVPSAMVMLSDDENTLILPKGVEMPVSDLIDVYYLENIYRYRIL